MTPSADMGRRKIDGLVRFPLRLLDTQLAEVVERCRVEGERRGDPSYSPTSFIREAIAEKLAREHDPQRKTRRGGSAP